MRIPPVLAVLRVLAVLNTLICSQCTRSTKHAYRANLCTVLLNFIEIFCSKHARQVPSGLGVWSNFLPSEGKHPTKAENTGSMSGFDTAHATRTRRMPGFQNAETAYQVYSKYVGVRYSWYCRHSQRELGRIRPVLAVFLAVSTLMLRVLSSAKYSQYSQCTRSVNGSY